jgi:hypothetical protein
MIIIRSTDINDIVGFEVLTAVVMGSIFWDITPCSPSKFNRRYEEHVTICSACYLLHLCFLLGLFFNLEDGGDMILRNVG